VSKDQAIQVVGATAAAILPLFNIPLIIRLVKRKCSDDFSITWALGVWTCIALMTPQTLRSPDKSFYIFGIMNIVFFTLVTFFILKYRRPRP
jgi:hypothetical protein